MDRAILPSNLGIQNFSDGLALVSGLNLQLELTHLDGLGPAGATVLQFDTDLVLARSQWGHR